MPPMSNDPHSEDRISAQVHLLNEAEAGRLDGLECRSCHRNSVSVSFTNPAPEEYRTWFLCMSCSFCTRAQKAARPRFFHESRVNAKLDRTDASILQQAKFRKPSNQK